MEPIEEDKKEEKDNEKDIKEGSSTEDLVPKQVLAETEESSVPAQEDGVMVE